VSRIEKVEQVAPPKPEVPDVAPARSIRRRWGRMALVAAALVAAAAFGGPWLMARFTTIHINDARIAGNVVTISAEVAGRITRLPVVAGDTVAKDDLIAEIDRKQAEPRIAAILAKLATADAQVEQIETQKAMTQAQLSARRSSAEAEVAAAEANHEAAVALLANAQSHFDRTEKLAERSVSSQQNLDEARAALDVAIQHERAAFAAINTARASLAIVDADMSQLESFDRQVATLLATRKGIEAEMALQNIDLAYRSIMAGFDGIVDATFVDVGEYVTPGTRLLMVHAPDQVWIDANVKETEFARIRLGAAARITVDAWPGIEFQGKVERLGGAATSQLALLPSPNPSGNFTKVTQRLPVRISIVPEAGVELRPGMMVEVYVDLAD
jgi:membrane fusion protein (multidrug efflux system)